MFKIKQIKIDIFTALKQSVELQTLGVSVNAGWISTSATFPCLAFYQVSGFRGIADGKLSDINIDELYSVDIFSKSMLEAETIAEAVDEVMGNLEYIVTREGNLDLFEAETNLFHKVLKYRIK